MEPLNEQDELKRIAPTLHALPKAEPFVVPEGFFDRFPHQVQAAIVARDPELSPAWSWWKRMALALPILALLGLGVWWLGTPASISTPVAFNSDNLPDDPDVMEGIDESELLAFIDEAHDIPADLGSVELRLDEQELLTYLESENLDLADLITDIE